jgi:quinol monooxygenase YgiN
MKIRLVVTMEAEAGRGAELAAVMAERAKAVQQEPGCEQFEMFRSVTEPDKLVLLELWADQAALDVHAKVNATRAPLPAGLRKAGGSREDYGYNRVR